MVTRVLAYYTQHWRTVAYILIKQVHITRADQTVSYIFWPKFDTNLPTIVSLYIISYLVKFLKRTLSPHQIYVEWWNHDLMTWCHGFALILTVESLPWVIKVQTSNVISRNRVEWRTRDSRTDADSSHWNASLIKTCQNVRQNIGY